MATQLLNAAALIAAMEQRANEYDQFLASLERLQDAIEGVLNLDRSVFDGEAATMIRAFFSDQQLLVAGWVTLAEVQVEFFRGVHGKLSDLDLDGQTRVSVPFLDEEIRHSQESLKGLIRAQQDSLATILSGIDDLVSLTPYDESGLIDGTRRAEDIRNKTLSNLHAADTELVNEYVLSEDQLTSVQGMITNYLQAITVNPDTQTIVYDTNAFHRGEAVQQRVEVEQRAAEYVEFKDEQHKQREAIAKAEAEQEALDNRSGWEKAWDGTVNVLAEVSGYNDASRAITGTDPVTGEELSWAERIKAGAMAAAGFIPVVGTGARLGATALRTADKAMDLAKGSHYVGAFHNSQKGLDLMKTAEYGLYGTATSLGLGEYMTGRDIFGNELTDEQRNNSLTQSLFIMGGGAVAHHADKLAGANAAFKTTGQQANTLLNRGVMHSQQFLRGVANDHRQAYNALKSGTQTAAQRIQQSLTPGGQQLAMAGGGRMSPDLGVRKEDVVVRSSSGGGKGKVIIKTVNEVDYSNIRAYRNIDIEKIPIEYRADPRLVSEMSYKGKKKSGANAAGWERNASKHFSKLLDKHPEFFSQANIERIENGLVPVVDDDFIQYFYQYTECRGDKLIHHHIGGGGQAAAVPQSLHKGFGGIHNFEKEHKIRDNDPLTDIGKVFMTQKKL